MESDPGVIASSWTEMALTAEEISSAMFQVVTPNPIDREAAT